MPVQPLPRTGIVDELVITTFDAPRPPLQIKTRADGYHYYVKLIDAAWRGRPQAGMPGIYYECEPDGAGGWSCDLPKLTAEEFRRGLVASYFIRSGETLNVTVPEGSYFVRYAMGKIWYGENELFGDATLYREATKVFAFTAGKTTLRGHTLELILQQRGNLPVKVIGPEEFKK